MMTSMALPSVTSEMEGNMEKRPYNVEADASSEEERDVAALARLGKKPILKVCSIRCDHFLKQSFDDNSDDSRSYRSLALLAPF